MKNNHHNDTSLIFSTFERLKSDNGQNEKGKTLPAPTQTNPGFNH